MDRWQAIFPFNFRILKVFPILSFLAGCASINADAPLPTKFREGSFTLSRAMPRAASLNSKPLFGFMPVSAAQLQREGQVSRKLIIDQQLGIVSLETSTGDKITAKAQGVERLVKGRYTVAHMQESPAWYAPAMYFHARHQPVPPGGSKERLRRGALGTRAIFIDKDTALHSGPFWSKEVGGIRIAEEDLLVIYRTLKVGSIVEVR